MTRFLSLSNPNILSEKAANPHVGQGIFINKRPQRHGRPVTNSSSLALASSRPDQTVQIDEAQHLGELQRVHNDVALVKPVKVANVRLDVRIVDVDDSNFAGARCRQPHLGHRVPSLAEGFNVTATLLVAPRLRDVHAPLVGGSGNAELVNQVLALVTIIVLQQSLQRRDELFKLRCVDAFFENLLVFLQIDPSR